MRKRIDQECSAVPEKSQPSGPTFIGKLGKPRFKLEQWVLGSGFFCPHWTPMMDSSHIPVTSLGIDKKAAQCHPHVGRTLIRDIIGKLNDVTMSLLSKFRISWKPFHVFYILNEVFSGEQEK